jgi:dTDP-4-dehydrorhamnose reductase
VKLIIVGASGYIGSPLFTLAESYGEALGTSSRGSDVLMPFELSAPNGFNYGLIDRDDVVLVTAAISAPDVCARDHDRVWDINVTGTSSFISSVISRRARVIFFSSDTVYGERTDEFDETATCNPAGDYAVMKCEVEKRFRGDPSFKAIRLSYVFSKEDKFTRYLNGTVARDEEAEIFHPFYRAVVHRDDVVQGAISLAQRWDEFPQSVINFGGPDVIARTEFAETLRDSVLPALRIRKIEPEPAFFANRPRVIRMRSPLLEALLERPARSLREAAQREFDARGVA